METTGGEREVDEGVSMMEGEGEEVNVDEVEELGGEAGEGGDGGGGHCGVAGERIRL